MKPLSSRRKPAHSNTLFSLKIKLPLFDIFPHVDKEIPFKSNFRL
jgi:hypothetical protein